LAGEILANLMIAMLTSSASVEGTSEGLTSPLNSLTTANLALI
jgi:hypothetical protein